MGNPKCPRCSARCWSALQWLLRVNVAAPFQALRAQSPELVARPLVPHHPLVDRRHVHAPGGSPQSRGRENQLSDEADGAEA